MQRGGNPVRMFINETSGDGNRLYGFGNDGEMNHVQDERGNIRLQNRICASRGAFRRNACSPVLTVFVWQGRVDELQRFSTSVVRGYPTPALMIIIEQPTSADAPIA